MAVKTFKFQLKIGAASYVDSFPHWNDEAAFNTEGDGKEMFFREKLNVKLTYQRDDFDAIYAAAFATEFRALLQQDISGVWTTLWTGRFWYTDIDFDVDNRTCSVSPETFDLYDDLLGGMGKEFNLIELEPPTTSVSFVVRPLIQIYFSGSDKITNYNGSIWAQQDVSPPVTVQSTLQGTYYFGTKYQFAVATGAGEGLNPDVAGIYAYDSGLMHYERADGVYRMGIYTSIPDVQVGVWRVSDNALMYAAPVSTSLPNVPADDTQGVLMTSQIDGTSQIRGFYSEVYMRLLTALDTVGGTPTNDIPNPDLLVSAGSYTKVLPITAGNFIEPSENNGATPTKWKKLPSNAQHNPGNYFAIPDTSNTWNPIMPERWVDVGFWMRYDATLDAYQTSGAKTIIIEHAYKLSDCISVLLAEIQPLVSHSDAAAYSDFLYSAGTNAIRGSEKIPVIIPKSNVVVGEYDQPATKATIRLSEIMELLRYVHNCYWHIESGTLKIEHEDYYHNGKSYSSESVGIDLTTGLEPKTGVAWDYRANRFKFDKKNIPERIETTWMDKGSVQFDGLPIQVNSLYAQRGNIERRVISKFTADIDYIHAAANDISKEGFVFLECEQGVTYLEVPFVTFAISADETYTMQNGYAALVYAHDKYHKHNLPAESVNMNRADITATTIKRSKMQQLTFANEADIDPYLLIGTNIGNGRVQILEQPINSNTTKATIRHNNE